MHMSIVLLSTLAALSTGLAVEKNSGNLVTRDEVTASNITIEFDPTLVDAVDPDAADPDANLTTNDDFDFHLDLSMLDGINANATELVKRATAQEKQVDTLLFATSMASFQSHRSRKSPTGLDWSSDGCSNSPDHPLGFNFLPSCQRHDFGYRNYKKEKRCAASYRAAIDSNLLRDLIIECNKHALVPRLACASLAADYYTGVHTLGWLKWC